MLKLVEPYFNNNRNVTTDNYFVTFTLGKILKQIAFTLVGSLWANKTCILVELKFTIGTVRWAFHVDCTLMSQVVKPKKSVYLLCTMHYGNKMGPRGKSAITEYYNKIKGGIDMMDYMLGYYTCKRSTLRWPLAMFFNMVDIMALAVNIIYDDVHKVQTKHQAHEERS